ncbi:hypothetical protein DRQ50_03100 [bacterium]|nr:MAG: hypothetical protein DRQ50_03100 [bacterium]
MITPTNAVIRGIAVTLLVFCAGFSLAGPTTVTNPAQVPRTETLELEELWRAGGEDDEDVLLGQIGNAATDAAGNVYVLDSQLAHVLKFEADGAYAGTLGREGDGPGEMRQPLAMDVSSDGRVSVVQPFPGRVIRLTTDGTPDGTFDLGADDPTQGGFAMIMGARERADQLVISGQRSSFDPAKGEIRGTRFLATVNQDGSEVRRHAEVTTSRNMERIEIYELAEYFPGDRGLWGLDAEGRLYTATSYTEYEITVTAPDGTIERVISRPHEARARTEDELKDLRGGMSMNINGREPEIVQYLQDHAPCIDALHLQDDGTLWVENSHARDRWDDEGMITYDVYDPDGRLDREVTVRIPGAGENDRPILLADGRFLLAVGQADLSISISAGNGDGEPGDAPVAATMPELVCFGASR